VEPQTHSADFAGVVVAAGRSARFGGAVPKQFQTIAGRTVLERSVGLLAAHPAVGTLVVVVAADRREEAEILRLRKNHPGLLVAEGGATRAESVRAGLDAVGPEEFVLVHDAARPLASHDLIDAIVVATREHGAAVPLLAVPDTVKRVGRETSGGETLWVRNTLDRSELRLAQTPQGSRVEWLVEALDRARDRGLEVTDESGALEAAGRRVAVVDCEPGTRKITSRDDLDDARRRLETTMADLRVSHGFDIHRFGEGRRLVLGGVEFPGEPGLDGHSDADVVLHAAMDAVLGPTGLGDIGTLFPPDDPRFAGADSRALASEVARRVALERYRVINLDLMLLAERPKIRPRVEEMRRSIADAFGIAVDRVGLKATTLERLGSLGRAEGMACQAVALLSRKSAT